MCIFDVIEQDNRIAGMTAPYAHLVNQWSVSPSGVKVWCWGIAMVGAIRPENVTLYLRTEDNWYLEIGAMETTLSLVERAA